MSVPSEKEFGEHLETVDACRGRVGNLINGLLSPDVISKADFMSAIDSIKAELASADKEVGATIFSAWVNKQGTSARAHEAIWGKRRGLSDWTEFAEREWCRITRERTAADLEIDPYYADKYPTHEERVEAARRQNEQGALSMRMRVSLMRLDGRRPFSVGVGVCSSFRDYFYAERHLDMARDGKAVEAHVQELRRCIRTLRDAEGANTLVPVELLPMGRRALDRLDGELAGFMSSFNAAALPVQRLDGTAKERALAYDLWRVFRRAFHANKVRAITYLMEFEGVNKQIEPRTLERMVAVWGGPD